MYEPLYPHHGEPYLKAMADAIEELRLWDESRIGKTLNVGYTTITVEDSE